MLEMSPVEKGPKLGTRKSELRPSLQWLLQYSKSKKQHSMGTYIYPQKKVASKNNTEIFSKCAQKTFKQATKFII